MDDAIDVVEIFADTNIVIEREYTEDERNQRLSDAANFEALKEAEATKVEADNATRIAAIEHAKTLGFTDAMINVMYPSLIIEGDIGAV